MRDERPRFNVCIYVPGMLPSTFLAKGKLSCLPADECAVLAVLWFPCSCWWHISNGSVQILVWELVHPVLFILTWPKCSGQIMQ
jgi:hypothetical protein